MKNTLTEAGYRVDITGVESNDPDGIARLLALAGVTDTAKKPIVIPAIPVIGAASSNNYTDLVPADFDDDFSDSDIQMESVELDEARTKVDFTKAGATVAKEFHDNLIATGFDYQFTDVFDSDYRTHMYKNDQGDVCAVKELQGMGTSCFMKRAGSKPEKITDPKALIVTESSIGQELEQDFNTPEEALEYWTQEFRDSFEDDHESIEGAMVVSLEAMGLPEAKIQAMVDQAKGTVQETVKDYSELMDSVFADYGVYDGTKTISEAFSMSDVSDDEIVRKYQSLVADHGDDYDTLVKCADELGVKGEEVQSALSKAGFKVPVQESVGYKMSFTDDEIDSEISDIMNTKADYDDPVPYVSRKEAIDSLIKKAKVASGNAINESDEDARALQVELDSVLSEIEDHREMGHKVPYELSQREKSLRSQITRARAQKIRESAGELTEVSGIGEKGTTQANRDEFFKRLKQDFDWKGEDSALYIDKLKQKIRESTGELNEVSGTGEKEIRTYAAWKKIAKGMGADKFTGDRDIDEAWVNGKSIGEWDGESGFFYGDAHLKKKINEVSMQTLAAYKKAAAADASKADQEGDFERGDKRFRGINKATMQQFEKGAKGELDESVEREINEGKIETLEKKYDMLRDRLDMAREKRRATGKSKGVQGQAEMKIQAQMDAVSREITAAKQALKESAHKKSSILEGVDEGDMLSSIKKAASEFWNGTPEENTAEKMTQAEYIRSKTGKKGEPRIVEGKCDYMSRHDETYVIDALDSFMQSASVNAVLADLKNSSVDPSDKEDLLIDLESDLTGKAIAVAYELGFDTSEEDIEPIVQTVLDKWTR